MKDLNMEHYDFHDLLQVFKIDIDQPIKFQIEKKQQKVNEIVEKYDANTASFFQKVFAIIACIGELADQSFILDINDDECIYKYISKIKIGDIIFYAIIIIFSGFLRAISSSFLPLSPLFYLFPS
jgi:hypothetical protein